MKPAVMIQKPSMENILDSIRRILAEEEAWRGRAGRAPMPFRDRNDGDSPTPCAPARNDAYEARAPGRDAREIVLLTRMIAANGTVVAITPTFPQASRASAARSLRASADPFAELDGLRTRVAALLATGCAAT